MDMGEEALGNTPLQSKQKYEYTPLRHMQLRTQRGAIKKGIFIFYQTKKL